VGRAIDKLKGSRTCKPLFFLVFATFHQQSGYHVASLTCCEVQRLQTLHLLLLVAKCCCGQLLLLRLLQAGLCQQR
jgi:hypothetical protein